MFKYDVKVENLCGIFMKSILATSEYNAKIAVEKELAHSRCGKDVIISIIKCNN